MAGKKYEKYIKREPYDIMEDHPECPGHVHLHGDKDFGGVSLAGGIGVHAKPFVMVDKAHTHDFHQFLWFLGCNPNDPKDFGAECEMSFGEEGEKYIIDAPAIIHIPPGLIHCPLNFKRVDKPFIFIDLYLTPTYVRKDLSK